MENELHIGNLNLPNFMKILFKHSMIFLIFPVIDVVFEEHHCPSELILLFGLSFKLKVLQTLCLALSIFLTLSSCTYLLTHYT